MTLAAVRNPQPCLHRALFASGCCLAADLSQYAPATRVNGCPQHSIQRPEPFASDVVAQAGSAGESRLPQTKRRRHPRAAACLLTGPVTNISGIHWTSYEHGQPAQCSASNIYAASRLASSHFATHHFVTRSMPPLQDKDHGAAVPGALSGAHVALLCDQRARLLQRPVAVRENAFTLRQGNSRRDLALLLCGMNSEGAS